MHLRPLQPMKYQKPEAHGPQCFPEGTAIKA